jgi:hypothetical protein
MTGLGVLVVAFLEKNLPEVCLPDLTSKMEKALDAIASGNLKAEKEIIDLTSEVEAHAEKVAGGAIDSLTFVDLWNTVVCCGEKTQTKCARIAKTNR